MTVEFPLILQNLTLPPSNEWSPQCPGWTMLRVAEGVGYCLAGGNHRELNVGDGFMAQTSKTMLVRASQLGFMRLQFLQIQPEFLYGLLTVTEWHQFEAMQRHSPCLSFFTAGELTGQKFTRLAEHACPESLPIRCALLQLWANVIGGLLVSVTPELNNDKKLRHHFRQMVGKIPEMDLARYAVADLAGQLHCSERHFSRLFREEFGVPFRNHQIELKLQHARQLLLESNIKIASIAGTSGYRHLGLFNNAFKKRFGVTPSEWRRQNLNSDTANQLRHSLPQLRQMPTPSIPVNQGC